MPVSFSVSRADSRLIDRIVRRAIKMAAADETPLDHTTLNMDITAVHANGNPLRLEELLAADDFNFAHDIYGISNCIDRKTGGLLRNFSPRYSVPQPSGGDDAR